MTRFARALFAAVLLLAPTPALAGPVEDAHNALDGWAAAYSTNDIDGLVKSYWPDAILFGHAGPDVVKGAEAIRKYYAAILAGGMQARIGARYTIAVDAAAVVVTGYYEFLVLKDGKPVSTPARFTMLFTKRGGEWRIAHHHSSLYVETKP